MILQFMNFNPSKTEAMLFSYTNCELFPNIVFDGVSVKFVNDHKYIGLTLSIRVVSSSM